MVQKPTFWNNAYMLHSGQNLFSTITEGFTGTKPVGSVMIYSCTLRQESANIRVKNHKFTLGVNNDYDDNLHPKTANNKFSQSEPFQAAVSKSGLSTLLCDRFTASYDARIRGCKLSPEFCDLELAVDLVSRNEQYFNVTCFTS
jgi:hypothetical protein